MPRTALIATAFACCPIALAGPLDPPQGPVAPTMKPLDSIEPRICLNDLRGDEGAVLIITEPGQYYLDADVLGQPGKHGIRIVTNGDVSIDLNGFVLRGVPGSLNGIDMDLGPQTVVGSRLSITSKEGLARASITSWGGDGIRTSGVIECQCTHLIVEDCGGSGIRHLHPEGVIHRDIATRNCLGDGTTITPPTQARARRGVTNRFQQCRARGNMGNGWNITTRPAASNTHFEDILSCGNAQNGFLITEDPTAPASADGGDPRCMWDRVASRDNGGGGVIIGIVVGSTLAVEVNDTSCTGNGTAGFDTRVSGSGSHTGAVHVYRRCHFNDNGTDGLRTQNPLHVESSTMTKNALYGLVAEGDDPNESIVVFHVCHLIANGAGGADIVKGRFSNFRSVVSDNGGPGIQTGDGCLLLTESSVTNNNGPGVITNGTLNIVSSDFRRNAEEGVLCINGSCVADGMVTEFNGTSGNGAPGASFINCPEVTLRNCVSNGNDGPGYRARTDSSIGPIRWMAPEALASKNGGDGFDLDNCDGAILERCKTSGNAGIGFNLGPNFINGRVEGCSANGDGAGGIWVAGQKNLVISCSATANAAGAFNIAQGNSAARVISGSALATSSDPRANIEH